jgi:hypothetical protein
MLRCRGVVGREVGLSWCNQAGLLVGTGILEHLSLSPGTVVGPGARFVESFYWDPTPATRQEGVMEVLYPCCCGLERTE